MERKKSTAPESPTKRPVSIVLTDTLQLQDGMHSSLSDQSMQVQVGILLADELKVDGIPNSLNPLITQNQNRYPFPQLDNAVLHPVSQTP